MAVGRIRSRQVETGSVNQRMMRRGSVKRTHLARWAVGKDQIQPGAISQDHLAAEAVREQNVHPSLIPRELLKFHFRGPLFISVSDDDTVLRGGRPLIVATLKVLGSADVEFEVQRFGDAAPFATIVVPAGEKQKVESFDTILNPFDDVGCSLTDPGADAEGLMVNLLLR